MRKGSCLIELAHELGMDKKKIFRAVHKLYPGITRSAENGYVLTEEQLEELRIYLARPEGVTVNQLADELQMEPARIRDRIRRLFPGITRTTYGYVLTEEQAAEIRRNRDLGIQAGKGSLWWRIERALPQGMSMKTAAKRMRMPYTAFPAYKRVGVYPPVRKLLMMAEFLNVSVDYLVGFSVKFI